MKAYLPLICLFFSIACGGGGGGGGESNLASAAYTGKTSPAVLDSSMSNEFFTEAFDINNNSSKATHLRKSEVNLLSKYLNRSISRLRSEPQYGELSTFYDNQAGYYTVDERAYDYNSYLGTVVFTFHDYYDENYKAVLSGSYTYNFINYELDGDDYHDHYSVTYNKYTIAGGSYWGESSGTIIYNLESKYHTITLNYSETSYANPNGVMYSNYIRKLSFYESSYRIKTETINGKFFSGDKGYVNISIPTELIYNYSSQTPESGSDIILTGSSSNAKIEVSTSIYTVYTDSDNDNNYESQANYYWMSQNNSDSDLIAAEEIAEAIVLPAAATFNYSPAIVSIGDSIVFDASLSVGQAGDIITSYSWDFEDDGIVDEITLSPQTTHEFLQSGGYSVRLTIQDINGNTSTISTTIIVLD